MVFMVQDHGSSLYSNLDESPKPQQDRMSLDLSPCSVHFGTPQKVPRRGHTGRPSGAHRFTVRDALRDAVRERHAVHAVEAAFSSR